MNGEWRITSSTRKAHLYLPGSDTAVCGKGHLNPGQPSLKLPDNTKDKCKFCRAFEKRLLTYPEGDISYGLVKA